jgi:threonine dehydratase
MDVSKHLIEEAAERISPVVNRTPLQHNKRLSTIYGANIYVKREDLQEIRSFKIRGAYNKISSLSDEEKSRGVVCASAGNHAQGVAYSCAALKIKGAIFMPAISPQQKVDKVRKHGGDYVEIHLVGQTFDDAFYASQDYAKETGAVYVHAFNDPLTIAGQGTVAKEVFEQMEEKGVKPDVLLVCVGGGGLISGIATYAKETDPAIKVIGSEPAGAAEMSAAIKAGHIVTLDTIDTFVDGAAIKTTGEMAFAITRKYVDDIVIVPEGRICYDIVELYQNEGVVAEPAGTLAISALEYVQDRIKGKNVVCILSGGNNDILRYPEILERSLTYQGLKHYFVVEFAQKPGQLKKFLEGALGPTDDIIRFEYMKKTNKEKGAALVGIQLANKEDLEPLLARMHAIELNFKQITKDDLMYDYLI